MNAPVQRFFSLSDRIGRLRYFTYTLAAMVASAFVLLAIYLASLLLPPALGQLVSTVSFILVKNVMIPLVVFVMSIRRLHDLGYSGWWSLTILVPFVTLVLLALPGKKDANRFGPPPGDNPPALAAAAAGLPAAVLGLYFYMVSINPAPPAADAPAAGSRAPLKAYGTK